jgi:hypothetical protein
MRRREVTLSPTLLARAEVIDETNDAETATDPSFADLLDQHSPVRGSNRYLPMVGRPLLATGPSHTMTKTRPNKNLAKVCCWRAP